MNRDNSCAWFHGKISREEAEHRLQQGCLECFLIELCENK